MNKINLIKSYMVKNELNIEKVMQDYTAYVYTILINKGLKLSEQDIEEIISDVFLAVWKNQKNLDIDKEMSAYLAGITKNIYIKKVRHYKSTIDIDDYKNNLYETENLEFKTENTEKYDLVIVEINKMKNEDKRIFMSYYYYAKSIKDIANELNISEDKVKSRLFRIRRKLKKMLEKRGYSYNG